MRVLSSAYGSRGDVEPMVGLAVGLRALGAEEVRACAPPDFGEPPRRAAELAAAAAEGCDALAAGGVMPAGVWL